MQLIGFNPSRLLRTVLMLAAVCIGLAPAMSLAAVEPTYSPTGELIRPLDYREWVYASGGLGMTYETSKSSKDQSPRFDNVFVTSESYREFLRSGSWPEKTMFILEIRQSETNRSINQGGRTQGGIVAIEAAVKDTLRFADRGGWAYFTFDGGKEFLEKNKPLPPTASCYACHRTHGAVDNTFVQFYPTLFEAAKRQGTVKPDFDPSRKP